MGDIKVHGKIYEDNSPYLEKAVSVLSYMNTQSRKCMKKLECEYDKLNIIAVATNPEGKFGINLSSNHEVLYYKSDGLFIKTGDTSKIHQASWVVLAYDLFDSVYIKVYCARHNVFESYKDIHKAISEIKMNIFNDDSESDYESYYDVDDNDENCKISYLNSSDFWYNVEDKPQKHYYYTEPYYDRIEKLCKLIRESDDIDKTIEDMKYEFRTSTKVIEFIDSCVSILEWKDEIKDDFSDMG